MKKAKKTKLNFIKSTVTELNQKKLLNVKGGFESTEGNDPNTGGVTYSDKCEPNGGGAGGSTLACGG